jgi:hypothetical protein
MNNAELKFKIEQIDRVAEQLVSETKTPNFDQTRDRWNQQVFNRTERTILQIQELKRSLKEIIDSRST